MNVPGLATPSFTCDDELRGEADAVEVSSRGRKRKPVIVDGSPFVKKSRSSSGSAEKKPKKGDAEREFEKHWICAECKEAECALDPSAESLLVCDGPCRRLFHYPCVNLKAVPAEDDPFFCLDCTKIRHRCAVCKDYGDDDEEVFKCRRDDCGFFFHELCLAAWDTEEEGKSINVSYQGDEADGKDADNFVSAAKPTFDCPAHHCWTCANTKICQDVKQHKRGSKKSGALEPKRGELYVRHINDYREIV
jgi:hypothetical protein